MPSWDYSDRDVDRWEQDYERSLAGVRQAAWEDAFRKRLGEVVPDGWRRPVDAACPQHGYGMVEGKCGVCVLEEASLSGRGKGGAGVAQSVERAQSGVDAGSSPAAGTESSPLGVPRPESDEREAA